MPRTQALSGPSPSHPIPSELIDLYKTADAGATVALMGKHAVERSFSSKLDDVRSSEAMQSLGAAPEQLRLAALCVQFWDGLSMPPAARLPVAHAQCAAHQPTGASSMLTPLPATLWPILLQPCSSGWWPACGSTVRCTCAARPAAWARASRPMPSSCRSA